MTSSSSKSFDPERFPRRLNLGCGFDQRDGYLNVDFQDFHEPDLQADVRDLSMLPDQFYEEVIAQDVLEHLPRTDTLIALHEWARVLKYGGHLILRVPDVIGIAKLLSELRSLGDQETLIQNLFGTQAYSGDFHYAAFTELLLRQYLYQAGFDIAALVHTDQWLFDVDAVRVTHPSPPDPDDLRHMTLLAEPPEPLADPVAVGQAREALEQARATAPVDTLGEPTRLRVPKLVLLRLMRLVTHKQVAHNQAVDDALEKLLEAVAASPEPEPVRPVRATHAGSVGSVPPPTPESGDTGS